MRGNPVSDDETQDLIDQATEAEPDGELDGASDGGEDFDALGLGRGAQVSLLEMLGGEEPEEEPDEEGEAPSLQDLGDEDEGTEGTEGAAETVRLFGREIEIGEGPEQVSAKTARWLEKLDSQHNELRAEKQRAQAEAQALREEMRERIARLEGAVIKPGSANVDPESAGAARGASLPPSRRAVDDALADKFRDETFEGRDIPALVEQLATAKAAEAIEDFKNKLLPYLATREESVQEIEREWKTRQDEQHVRAGLDRVGRSDLAGESARVNAIFQELRDFEVERLGRLGVPMSKILEDVDSKDGRNDRFERAIVAFDRLRGSESPVAAPVPKRSPVPTGRVGAGAARTRGVTTGKRLQGPFYEDETLRALASL